MVIFSPHGAPGREAVGLAPLAGYSDAPYRLLCARHGADFAVTEMVSSDGLVRNGAATRFILEVADGEAPLGVQIFGTNPDTMARAAVIAAAGTAAWIDLNFGCPVRKVTRKNGGVSIMRDLPLMGRICAAVVRAVDIPVTAKIRSGWSAGEENYIEAGRVCEENGVAAVTLHPRYRTQGFSGSANWEHIADLADRLTIPVVANGDVWNVDDYQSITAATHCRIVMVGRGAIGNPWLFEGIKDHIEGRESVPVPFDDRIAAIERLLKMEVSWRGERSGILETRKHYRWFFKGLPGMKEHRSALSRAGTINAVLDILRTMRKESCSSWKKPA